MLNLKFKFPAKNTLLLLAGNLNFKLRIVFWNIFFLKFGDLKNESHFLKKATFIKRYRFPKTSLMVHTKDFSKGCVFLSASTIAKERNTQPFENSLVHTVQSMSKFKMLLYLNDCFCDNHTNSKFFLFLISHFRCPSYALKSHGLLTTRKTFS